MFDKITRFTDSAFEKIDSFLNKKIVIWAIVILTTILGSIYYYGIISITKPNAEDCLWPYQEFLSRLNGTHIGFSNIIDRISFTISYSIHGFSYKMPWLNFTIRYSIILFFSIVLSIIFVKKNKCNNLYVLPIVVIFLILLPIPSDKPGFGFIVDPNMDVFAGYDFNYHQNPLIIALLCVICCGIYEKIDSKYWKIAIISITFVITIYGILTTDLIFIVMFIGPIFLVLFFRNIRKPQFIKYMVVIIFIAIMFLLYSKYTSSTTIHEMLWASSPGTVYGGDVYGNTSWRIIQEPFKNVENYYRLIIELFGLNRSDTTVLSIWSIIMVVKFVMVIVGFYIVGSVFLSTINNMYEYKDYDIIDQICAFAVILFSFIDIFTYLSISVQTSYFMGILISITILIARNFINIINSLCKTQFFISIHGKFCAFSLGCIFSLLAINNVWAYHIDTNGSDIDKCIEYIYETGNGYVIAPHYLFGRLAMQSEGKVLFFGTEDQLKNYMGKSATPRYIVSKLDEDSLFYNYDSSCSGHYGNFGQEDLYSFKKLTDEYGEPIETKKFGNIWIHRLW